MNVPGDQHEAVSAEQSIAVCFSLLDGLNQAIQHRKWSLVSRIAADYSERIRQLTASESESSSAEQLIQLEIRHRRCMRILSRHMEAMAEDIASLETGQKTLQRSREVAEVIFQ